MDLSEQLQRHPWLPAWIYTGPLEPAQAEIRAMCEEVEERKVGRVYVLSTRRATPGTSSTTTTDTAEEAWRVHIGLLFGEGKPYPDDARPGETLVEFRARTGEVGGG